MAFIKWDEKYSVGIQVVDEQHQRLFTLINNFYDAIRQKETQQAISGILQGLAEYSIYHFSTEEKLMETHQYPGYRVHQEEHRKFVETVKDFQTRFEEGQLLIPVEIANFLKTWLTGHVLGNDQKFAPFLRKKGVQ